MPGSAITLLSEAGWDVNAVDAQAGVIGGTEAH